MEIVDLPNACTIICHSFLQSQSATADMAPDFYPEQLPLEPCKLLKIVAWVWRWVVEVINLSGVTT